MDTNKSDQDRVLTLLEKQRYPMPGQVVPTAAQLHALTEALVYLVQSTPPMDVTLERVQAAMIKKTQRGPGRLG